MLIKLLLVSATVLVAWYALRQDGRSSRLALRRVLGGFVAVSGVLAVLWPDAVTWLANRLGVGRGADLVLYGAVAVFAFVAVSLYGRVRGLERDVTTLVRELALVQAGRPDDHRTDVRAA